jgi:hypothetical protein
MHVPPLHQAEHLAGEPAHVQRLAIEYALERIKRPHDVAYGAIPVYDPMGGLGLLRAGQNTGIGFPHHLFAVIDTDEVVLKEVMVEHVLGGFAEIDDPLGHVRGSHPEGHVLGVHGAGRVVVPADTADPAGDEVRIARILAAHEHTVPPKDG